MAVCEGQKPFSRGGDFPQAPPPPPTPPPPPFTIGFDGGNDVPSARTSIWGGGVRGGGAGALSVCPHGHDARFTVAAP